MKTAYPRRHARLWIAALLSLGAVRAAAADDTVVKAALEPPVIGVGELATFSIEVTGSGFSQVGFHPDFELDNLEVVGGPSQVENIQIVNSRLARSFSISWRLRPLHVGKAGVRSLRVQLARELIQMRDREITVQEQPTGQADEANPAGSEEETEDPLERFFGGPLFQRRPQPTRRPAVFLRAEVQPQKAWVGQQVLYTVYLYTHDDISSMAAREMPAFRGFWVRDVPQPQHLPTDMVMVGGERYARVPVLQKALFPLRPGSYTIEPAAMDVIARVVEPRFFGPPLAHPEQVSVKAPAMPVEVQPLPPAPPGFRGAVGQLRLTARLDPATLRVGEAATLTVTLAGQGNVQGVGEPAVAPPPGLRIFPPQQQGDDRVVGTAVQGSRSWSWVIVPESPGRTTLRVPEIPFFDPQSGQYQVASSPPIEVTTLPPAVASTSASMLSSLRRAGSVQGKRPGLTWQALLPWLLAIPWGIALVVVLARRRRSPRALQAEHTVLAASGGVAPAAGDELLRRLDAAAAEIRPRQAAAHIEEAWREFLVRRWEIPPRTPSPRWGEALCARGADAAAAEELVRLANDLHYLRYAPQLSACETLCGEAVLCSRRLLRHLR